MTRSRSTVPAPTVRWTVERKPLTLSSQPVIFSPKAAGVIWWVLVAMLLAAVIVFSVAWLTQNSAGVPRELQHGGRRTVQTMMVKARRILHQLHQFYLVLMAWTCAGDDNA
jgi:hypothetical protein